MPAFRVAEFACAFDEKSHQINETLDAMLKKRWLILASLIALVVVSGLVMFVLNSTPVVPTVSLNDSGAPSAC